MDKDWTCPDCSKTISYSILDKENEDRKAKGISLMVEKFMSCRGMGKHIAGVGVRVYSLTRKGKIISEEAERMIKRVKKRLPSE